MLYLTTYFDRNYLSRGIVLLNSLNTYVKDFELYILCLDDFTLSFFKNNIQDYPQVRIITLSEIEETDRELFSSKSSRSTIEYYFTLSPCLPLYLLEKYNIPHICSLDADILFVNSPEQLFEKLNNFSVIITPHKFSTENEKLIKYGKYNVSFQIFKNDKIGIQCLKHWKKECIEWCSDKYDEINNRFADQKYLDNWTELYPNSVYALNDNVSGIAPWNLNNYEIKQNDGVFYSNSEHLIFYHFHGFRILSSKWAIHGLGPYKVNISKGINQLYSIYWSKIEEKNNLFSINIEKSSRNEYSNNIKRSVLSEKYIYMRIFRKLINIKVRKTILKPFLKIYA